MILLDSARPFYKANFHLHTTNSDGRISPEEAIALYREHGYDVLAITDHWKITRESGMDGGMLVLAGVEFDFNLPGQVIHMLGLGVGSELLEKVTRASGAQRAADEIREQGGIPVLAHPAWSLNSPDVMGALCGVNCAEVYNTVSGAPWNAERADSTLLLDVMCAQGKLYRYLATDDAHFYNGDQCRSYTMLQADALTPQGILDALNRGSFYASRGPEIYRYEFDGEVFRIDCSPATKIIFASDLNWVGGRCFTGENLTHAEYAVQRKRFERFVRCQIWDANGNAAWTNPIAV